MTKLNKTLFLIMCTLFIILAILISAEAQEHEKETKEACFYVLKSSEIRPEGIISDPAKKYNKVGTGKILAESVPSANENEINKMIVCIPEYNLEDYGYTKEQIEDKHLYIKWYRIVYEEDGWHVDGEVAEMQVQEETTSAEEEITTIAAINETTTSEETTTMLKEEETTTVLEEETTILSFEETTTILEEETTDNGIEITKESIPLDNGEDEITTVTKEEEETTVFNAPQTEDNVKFDFKLFIVLILAVVFLCILDLNSDK